MPIRQLDLKGNPAELTKRVTGILLTRSSQELDLEQREKCDRLAIAEGASPGVHAHGRRKERLKGREIVGRKVE